jgi:hypothetical protein
MNFKNTYKQFGVITNLIIKGLRQQLSIQEYYSTGKLSRSFTGVSEKLKNDNIILNITSSKDYWKVVNDPRVAFSVNKQNIVRWMNTKGLDKNFATAVYKRLARGVYGNMKANGKENYVYWKRGNSLQRSNFAGIVALEESNKVAQELAHSIGEDVADMIREEIRKIKPKAQIS